MKLKYYYSSLLATIIYTAVHIDTLDHLIMFIAYMWLIIGFFQCVIKE